MTENPLMLSPSFVPVAFRSCSPARRCGPARETRGGRNVEQVFGEVPRPLRPALVPLREMVLYLPTPPLVLAKELRRLGCDAILHEARQSRSIKARRMV